MVSMAKLWAAGSFAEIVHQARTNNLYYDIFPPDENFPLFLRQQLEEEERVLTDEGRAEKLLEFWLSGWSHASNGNLSMKYAGKDVPLWLDIGAFCIEHGLENHYANNVRLVRDQWRSCLMDLQSIYPGKQFTEFSIAGSSAIIYIDQLGTLYKVALTDNDPSYFDREIRVMDELNGKDITPYIFDHKTNPRNIIVMEQLITSTMPPLGDPELESEITRVEETLQSANLTIGDCELVWADHKLRIIDSAGLIDSSKAVPGETLRQVIINRLTNQKE